jgi:hypothetical protein
MKTFLQVLTWLEHSGAYYNEAFPVIDPLVYERTKEEIETDLKAIFNYGYPKNGRFVRLLDLLIEDRFG